MAADICLSYQALYRTPMGNISAMVCKQNISGKTQSTFLTRGSLLHSSRHTHTALLAEAGVPLETISRRLCHANSGITRNIYMHVTNQIRDSNSTKLKLVKLLDIC